MNGFYSHIKHSVDTSDYYYVVKIQSILRLGLHCQNGEHEANQLDGKQRHTGFNYNEYDMPKFGILGWAQCLLNWNCVSFREHLEDLEHDQARHQGIHGHGQRETC